MAGRDLSEIPRRASFDLLEGKERGNTIKLYVRRVFTIDDCDELRPNWLNVIKGAVNSDDLSLSISRETQPQSKIPRVINKNLVKKCFVIFYEIANKEKGNEIYEQLACWCVTAHESIRGVFLISPPRMGGACEHVSELTQFPEILTQSQLDDIFARAWDHDINAGVDYSRASKCLVSEGIIA